MVSVIGPGHFCVRCNVSTLDVHPRGLFYNNSFSVVSRRVLDESDMMHNTSSVIH